jgi:protein TonB
VAGAVVRDGGTGIGDGSSSEAGSGATTTRAEPGVRARPRYRSNPEPIYPASARLRRQEGLVLLRVDVTADGRASRVALEKSAGVSALDEAALEAVRGWEFEPARVGSEAVASRIEVPVRFKLAD